MLADKATAYTREEVRKRFGVSDDKLLVFISLGGGGDETNPETLRNLLQILSQIPQVQLLFAEGLLAKNAFAGTDNILVINEYPASKLLNGIDFALASAGYNTFHELLYFGVPTIFMPKLRGYDDQALRAQRAADKGACLMCVENEDFKENVTQQINLLLDSELRGKMRTSAQQYVPQNHVQEAARTVIEAWQQWELT